MCSLSTVAVACLTVAAAACGGGDEPESSAESRAAVVLVEAACERWNATVEARGDFPLESFDAENPSAEDLPTVGDFFAAGHAARDEMIDGIAALDVPAGIRADFAALVAALQRGQATAKEQAAAAQAGDVDGFVATLDEADASQQAIDEAADTLGPTKCTA